MLETVLIMLYSTLNKCPVVGVVVENARATIATRTIPTPFSGAEQPNPVNPMQSAIVRTLGPSTEAVRSTLTTLSTVGSALTKMSNPFRP